MRRTVAAVRATMTASALVVGCGGSNGQRAAGDSGTSDSAASSSASGSSGSGSGDSSGSSGASSSGSSSGSLGDAGPDIPPSCQAGGEGLTNCGPSSESCCASPEVTGGTFYRTYDLGPDGGVDLPSDGGVVGLANPATVSSFRLDKYDVTVGRFRQFVRAWNGGAGYTPPAGSGKHTHVNDGQGLANSGEPGTYEPGWATSDNGKIAPTDANLSCGWNTWTPSPGGNENLPISCVNWWEAYAFCIWDDGFLPSEAEWGYASAGGSQQRQYPWGSAAPGTACPGTGCQYAIYTCDYPSGSGKCSGVVNIAPVGTATLGAGLWGQVDLQGNMTQWSLDWYAAYVDPCADCAYLAAGSTRVQRGANYSLGASSLVVSWLLPPIRFADTPSNRMDGVGFRCARTP